MKLFIESKYDESWGDLADSCLDWCLERNPSLTGGFSEGDIHLVLPSGEKLFSLDVPERHEEMISYMMIWANTSSRKIATVQENLVDIKGENKVPMSQCNTVKK